MLYIIGGTSRSGKTTTAKRILKEAQIPYFSLDYLMMGIANGIPELGVQPTEGDLITGRRMWKVVLPLMTAMIENHIDYTIEGVQLLPNNIRELEQKFPCQIKSCFIGLAELDVEKSVEAMKYYSSQTENDGFIDLSYAETVTELERIKSDSLTIRKECGKYNLKYFESSVSFHHTIDEVVTYLMKF
ncbi:adenylate kinase [Paenibacillus sp. RC67]|uniref:adenylate kinase n=1 Tax=Paenibacillus sp. RC67 TaxID=3039392 RepID=UPI0024AE4FFD|nr:adenylate kinase [Paenibacillus sp. RC67]